MPTFAEQFIAEYQNHLSGDKAERAKTQSDPGMLSRIFNDFDITLSKEEYSTLRNTQGWYTFAHAIATQVKPCVDELLKEKRASSPTHVTELSEYSADEVIKQLTGAVMACYAQSFSKQAALDADMTVEENLTITSRIGKIVGIVNEPSVLDTILNATAEQPGPIHEHYDELNEAGKMIAFAELTKEVTSFENTLRGANNAALKSMLDFTNRFVIEPESFIETLPKFVTELKQRAGNVSDIPDEVYQALLDLEEKIPNVLEPYASWDNYDQGINEVALTRAPQSNTSANIVADWQRALTHHEIFINNMPLEFYATQFDFNSEEGIESFIKKVLLKDVKEEHKDGHTQYLKSMLHQGAFLYPVMTGIVEKVQAGTSLHDHRIDFEVDDDTLIIRERVKIDKLTMHDATRLVSDTGSGPVIKGDGAIKINFESAEPDVQTEHCHIQYNNAELQEKMGPGATFAEQAQYEISKGYLFKPWPVAESNKDGGMSRVFDKLHASPSNTEVQALEKAMANPAKFHKLICQQLAPLVQSLFGESSGYTENDKKDLIQGLFKHYALSIINKNVSIAMEVMPLMAFIQSPEDILSKTSPFPNDAKQISESHQTLNREMTSLNALIKDLYASAKNITVEDEPTQSAINTVKDKLQSFVAISQHFNIENNDAIKVHNFKQKLPSLLHDLKQYRRELEDDITKLDRIDEAHNSSGLSGALLPIIHAGQDIVKGLVRLIDNIYDMCKSLDVQVQKHMTETQNLVDELKPKLENLKKSEGEDETPAEGMDLN